MYVELKPPKKTTPISITLDGSKSESNRMLVIDFLRGNYGNIKNISTSDDTKALKGAFQKLSERKNSSETVFINVGHAGTTMRFLTAVLSITEGNYILDGSERMRQRPIKILVDALKTIGANIEYVKEEGFPPLKITGKSIIKNSVEIEGNVSSQYISALLLIAPRLKNGLRIILKNKVLSLPYIKMTIQMLQFFGIAVSYDTNTQTICVEYGKYERKEYVIESDWSGASYWYSLVSLIPNGEATLSQLYENSKQGDSILGTLYSKIGIVTTYKNGSVHIKNTKKHNSSTFNFDFTECPDLAQTYAVTLFLKGVSGVLTGLDNLSIKETDRLEAIVSEINSFFPCASHNGKDTIILKKRENTPMDNEHVIQTYHDHRMAMAMTPVALLLEKIIISDPFVVKKSYPQFWEDLKKFGFEVKFIKQ